MGYRVLIAIGEASHLTVQLAIAVPLARARQGRVTPLYVAAGGERPGWLTIPEAMRDVVDDPIVLDSADVPGAILASVRKTKPDLLLLHWRGHPSRGRYLLGRNLDRVIQYAPCDVAVVRAAERASDFEERMNNLQSILVPSGGGPNTSVAPGLLGRQQHQADSVSGQGGGRSGRTRRGFGRRGDPIRVAHHALGGEYTSPVGPGGGEPRHLPCRSGDCARGIIG